MQRISYLPLSGGGVDSLFYFPAMPIGVGSDIRVVRSRLDLVQFFYNMANSCVSSLCVGVERLEPLRPSIFYDFCALLLSALARAGLEAFPQQRETLGIPPILGNLRIRRALPS